VSLATPRFDPAPATFDGVAAFAGFEVQGIARGLVTVDALVKKAASRVVLARPVSPGKFLVLIDGRVAEVEESLLEAEAIAADQKIDRFFLPFAHAQLEPAVFGRFPPRGDELSVGIVETATTCSGLRSADAALKAADVSLLVVHLSVGIGGKCWYAFAGELWEVQASVVAASEALGATHLLGTEIIARPHPEFIAALGL
jgi:microcompartment protein CcmL/EutN